MDTLLAHLPADSAYVRTIKGEDSWTDGEHLQAITADRLGQLVWLTTEIHRDRKKSPKPSPAPEPLPRPGRGRSNGHQPEHKAKREHASIEDLKRFFGQPAGR